MQKTFHLASRQHILLAAIVLGMLMIPLVLLAQPAHAESTGGYSMNDETNTLTLTDYVSDEAITLEQDTTIVVQGECTLNFSGPAINAPAHNIILTGSGSLTLTNGGFVSCTDLTLDENFTGSLSAKNMPGLLMGGSYTQKNGTVEVASLMTSSSAERCTGSFLGGSFTATTVPGIICTGEAEFSVIIDGCSVNSHGFISGSKDFHMKSGSVKVETMPGLSFGDSITIDDGTVEANNSFVSAKNITVNGGTINAGNNDDAPSLLANNQLTINDGIINAKCFIYAGNITVKGGTLDVTSNEDYCLAAEGDGSQPGHFMQTGGKITCKQTGASSCDPLVSAGKLSITGGTFAGNSLSNIGLYARDSIAIDWADVQCEVTNAEGKGATIATEPNGTITFNNLRLIDPTEFTFGTATYPFPSTSSPAIEDHVFKVLLAADGSPATSFKALPRDLDEIKADAIAELNKINLANYLEPEKSIVKNAVENAKKAIESAENVVALNTAVAAANKTIKAQGIYNAKLPKVTNKKPVKGKKKMTVKWKKLSKKKAKQVTGIEIQYAQNKAFTQNAKMVTVKKTKKSKKIKKLVSKKTYWVRVRTYKNTSTGKLVGNWSKVKKVKVK